MKLYTVYDKEAKTYSTPMPQPNDVAATRMFAVEINRPDPANMLNLAPEHFSLWRIGAFNTDTGSLQPELTKLMEATTLKRA